MCLLSSKRVGIVQFALSEELRHVRCGTKPVVLCTVSEFASPWLALRQHLTCFVDCWLLFPMRAAGPSVVDAVAARAMDPGNPAAQGSARRGHASCAL